MIVIEESISSQALVSSPSIVSDVMESSSMSEGQHNQYINNSFREYSGTNIDNSCSIDSCSTGCPRTESGADCLLPGETRFYIGDEEHPFDSNTNGHKLDYLMAKKDESGFVDNSPAGANKLDAYVMNIIDDRTVKAMDPNEGVLYCKLEKQRYEPRYPTSESEAQIVLNQDYDDEERNPYITGKDPSDVDVEKYFNNGSFGKVRIISVVFQVFLAIILSSAGNFGAGIILDLVQKWPVFHHVPELYYLIPTLLGLKGNLEMTMVARLSTQANMGRLNSCRRTLKCMMVNISLVQCQAIVVSILASLVTFLATYYETSSDEPQQFVTTILLSNDTALLADNATTQILQTAANSTVAAAGSSYFYTKLLVIFSTSLFTANAACFGSSMFMIMMIVVLTNLKINPDNFATAIAASVGDIVTSFLLGLIGEFIFVHTVYLPGHPTPVDAAIRYNQDLRSPVLALTIIVSFLVLFPLLAWVACREKSTGKVLFGVSAWTPIIIAMMISFFSGAVLRIGAVMFRFMALFQPLINGVGGNLAAITTSRLSTELHMQTHNNLQDKQESKTLSMVLSEAFYSFLQLYDQQNVLVIVFVFISIVVQIFYGYLLPLSQNDSYLITALFYLFYVIASSFQVLILLIFTRFLVRIIWWMGKDPDTCAIPILTAVGDLLGTVFLMLVFCILHGLGNPTAALPLLTDDVPADLLTVTIPTETTMVVLSQLPFVNYTSSLLAVNGI